MRLSKQMLDMLNKQITNEMVACHNYLSMASWFDDQELTGFGNWFRKQAEEERGHAMKVYEYILDRREQALIDAVPAPKQSWKSPLEAAQDALKNEEKNSDNINKLMAQSKKENDYATESFLKWFVDEQVEEESSAEHLVERLEILKDSKSGLLDMDRELSQRKE